MVIWARHLTHRQAFILCNHRNSQTLQNHTFLQGKSLNKTTLVFHYLFDSKIMFSKSQDDRFAAFQPAAGLTLVVDSARACTRLSRVGDLRLNACATDQVVERPKQTNITS